MVESGDDRWTLVTVTYNSRSHLAAHWDGVNAGARWIVVDNNSSDDSVAVAESLGAEVIRLDENLGFSAANNLGLREVATEWCMFVNPDVHVGSPEDLDRLAQVSRHNRRSLVAPRLVNADGSEQANARGFPFLSDKFANRGLRLPGSRLDDYTRLGFATPTFAAWITGAAMGGPTETFRDLGGWDDGYFIYYEDLDLSLRAWLDGVPVVVDPHVRWLHAWQRATTSLQLTPWKHELASVRRFYRAYPELVTRRRMDRRPDRYVDIAHLLWQPAADPA